MLYLIGLGLNVDGISKYGLEITQRCKKVYLENYTVDFPYNEGELKEVIGKKIVSVDRDFVETFKMLDEAKRMDVALLIYGSPLTSTTHISLIHEAKESGIKYKIIYNGSIFDAISETGLQIYKFGKTTSIPAWDEEKNFTPDSFIDTIKENKSINAHTLLLSDIGLEFSKAIEQLEISARNKQLKLDKIIICQSLGTKYSKVYYDKIENLKEKQIRKPFCIIIPSKLHFFEKEILEEF